MNKPPPLVGVDMPRISILGMGGMGMLNTFRYFQCIDGYLNAMMYFIDCVKNNIEPVNCTPESTRNSLLLVEKELAGMQKDER